MPKKRLDDVLRNVTWEDVTKLLNTDPALSRIDGHLHLNPENTLSKEMLDRVTISETRSVGYKAGSLLVDNLLYRLAVDSELFNKAERVALVFGIDNDAYLYLALKNVAELNPPDKFGLAMKIQGDIYKYRAACDIHGVSRYERYLIAETIRDQGIRNKAAESVPGLLKSERRLLAGRE